MAITLPSDDGQPLFVELEGHLKTIKPAVQTIYDLLGTVERLWRANGADMILAATKPDAVPLGQGSTTAGEWLEYQRLFRALREWIESPVVLAADPEGTKPGPIPLVVISRRPLVLPASPVVNTTPAPGQQVGGGA